MSDIFSIHANRLDGTPSSLDEYKGRVLLIVNVASECGLTPQYTGLQTIFDRYQERGFEVLGFPCNQFGAQEPGSAEEIRSFCTGHYGVSFPMFEKVDVNGTDRHPLYAWLTGHKTSPAGEGDITWNFEKFLINTDGTVIARFAPSTDPQDEALIREIERHLSA